MTNECYIIAIPYKVLPNVEKVEQVQSDVCVPRCERLRSLKWFHVLSNSRVRFNTCVMIIVPLASSQHFMESCVCHSLVSKVI